jgi:drug/metabolite transporter (DMT)-like permease
MRLADAVRLTALAAIWGASFIFMRVISPVLGPLWTTEARLLIGAAALLVWFAFTGLDAQWRRHIPYYAAVGVLGTGLPFALFAFAALQLPGSTMSILNTTAPIFALLLGAMAGWERFTVRRLAGVALGALGVWLVTPAAQGEQGGASFLWAVAACLCASFLFAVTTLVVRRWGSGVPATGAALGAQVCAAVVLLPLLPLWTPAAAPSALVLGNVVALGLLGGALAYILYFRLVADIGAANTQTVSLLIPAFGLLWGALFLGEALGWASLAGAGCIVLGTVLITRVPA